MDEKINKETVEGEPGATEPPAQPPSETQAAPSAVDEASLKAILEPMIEDAFERQEQSIKDKRIAKQESRISSLEDSLAKVKELQAEGMSEKQAIQYMEMQDFLISQGKTIPTEASPTEEPAVQPKVAVGDYLSPMLQIAGIDANDPDVIALLRDESDPFKQMAAVGVMAESRKQTTPPNLGATLPSGAGKAVETETLESIGEQLRIERAKPKKDHAKLKELGARHKELLPKE